MKFASLLALSTALWGGVYFEPNRGQTNSRIAFIARGNGVTAAIAASSLELSGRDGTRTLVYLAGAAERSPATGKLPLRTVSHYALDRDPSRWIWDVPRFAEVEFASIYPGIDLAYHAREGQIEFDFAVAPHADPSKIQLRFDEPVRLNSAGDLVIGKTRLRAPKAWQTKDRQQSAVPVRFKLTGKRGVAFTLGAYDHSLPLIIDPIVEFATFLGGTENEWNTRIAAGKDGAIYVAGTTISADFPAALPGANMLNRPYLMLAPDVYVSRVSPSGGELDWSLFLGGNREDTAFALRQDESGNLYLLGGTSSVNFPVTTGAFRTRIHPDLTDLFLMKLDAATGHIQASTFLGAYPLAAWPDRGARLAVDSAGDAYIAGTLNTTTFQTTPGVVRPTPTPGAVPYGYFAMRLNARLSAVVFATFLDFGSTASLELDEAGNLVLAGIAAGCSQCGTPPFPAVNPIPGVNQNPIFPAQAYVAKLNSTGTTVSFASLLHGDGRASMVSDSRIAPDGTIHLIGYSDGERFPQVNPLDLNLPPGTQPPQSPVPFSAKLSATGTLIQSTLFNGSEYHSSPALAYPQPLRIALTPSGTICLLNIASHAFLQSPGGLVGESDWSGSMACVNDSGTALGVKTFLPLTGGSGYAEATVTHDGVLLLAGSGATSLTTTPGSLQPLPGGGVQHDQTYPFPSFVYGDAFLMKVSLRNPSPRVTGIAPDTMLLETSVAGTRPLSVYGSGFAFGTTVTWNGKPVESRFIDSRRIFLPAISYEEFRTGSNAVGVSLLGPGGGDSQGVLTGINATPANVRVSPPVVNAGAPETKLTIRADNIMPNSTLYWNDEPRAAQYVADSPSRNGHFELILSAAELAAPFTARIAIGSPPPGGGTSPEVAFSVPAAGVTIPVLSVPAAPFLFGGSIPLGPQIALRGSGLTSATKVFWDGVEIPVQFVAASQLNVQPPPSDLARWGSHEMYAANGDVRSATILIFVGRSVAQTLSTVDTTRKKLHFLERDFSAGVQRHNLVTLDLERGDLLASERGVGNAPQAIAVSTDGRYVFIAEKTSSETIQIKRYDTDAGVFDLEWPLPGSMAGSILQTILPVPGSPETIVTWASDRGIEIFDRNVARFNTPLKAGFKLSDSPAFVTSSRIYLNGPNSACWQWMEYDLDGITGGSKECSSEPPRDMVRDGDLIYLWEGERSLAVSLPDRSLPLGGGHLVEKLLADVPHRRAYALRAGVSGILQTTEFNLDTQQQRLTAPSALAGPMGLYLYPGVNGGALLATFNWITLLK